MRVKKPQGKAWIALEPLLVIVPVATMIVLALVFAVNKLGL